MAYATQRSRYRRRQPVNRTTRIRRGVVRRPPACRPVARRVRRVRRARRR